MVDRDNSPQEQAYKEERRKALHTLLAQHVSIDGATTSMDEQGVIHAVTPEITTDSTLFKFRDNDDVGGLYDLVVELGGFNISIKVPSIGPDAKYAAFGITTFNLATPRDHEIFRFLTQLGNTLGENTTIGTPPPQV